MNALLVASFSLFAGAYILRRKDTGIGAPGDCAAVNLPIASITTDEKRFQNRKDAFSAASADAVARNYNPNLFDPIVVWQDPRNQQTYVLSGHSRLQGMKQRGAKEIPARYFVGTEAQAIQFARVEANRAANQETLVEDLGAFRLMRDGDKARGLKPQPIKELKLIFRGKYKKLDSYSYLNPKGKFVAALSNDTITEFPWIENRAQMMGYLRKDHPELTNVHEDDVFNFIYGSPAGMRMKREDLEALILKRLAFGKQRLFPECQDLNCEPLRELDKMGPAKKVYSEIEAKDRLLRRVRERLTSSSPADKIYTEQERQYYQQLGQVLQQELKQLRKDAGIIEEQDAQGLFGIGRPVAFRNSHVC